MQRSCVSAVGVLHVSSLEQSHPVLWRLLGELLEISMLLELLRGMSDQNMEVGSQMLVKGRVLLQHLEQVDSFLLVVFHGLV